MSEPKPPPGHFLILYFASAATFTKRAWDHFPAPLPATELFRLLESKYVGINQKVLCSCAVVVNNDYVDVAEDSVLTIGSQEGGEDQAPAAFIIKDGDEVAIIPPVSSG